MRFLELDDCKPAKYCFKFYVVLLTIYVVVLMFLLVKIMCALFILCERFKVLCERLIITPTLSSS